MRQNKLNLNILMTSPVSITFETKCYERDWYLLFHKGHLEKKIDNCGYNFNKKVLYINNVNDITLVKTEADRLISKGIIDEYYAVEDYADGVLEHFDIKKESFKGGYYYSIAELTGIYLCKTEYLLHFSGDSYQQKHLGYNWIDKGVQYITETPNVIVTNPAWDYNNMAPRINCSEWSLESGFSDQCYLIKTEFFNKKIYNEYHPLSDRYPKYGGELFEKRVDSYMKTHNLFRANNRYVYYVHKNLI